LEEALKLYQKAREEWSVLANSVDKVYKKDVSAGETAHLRGHWLDRLPAMDEDIVEMKRLLDAAKPTTTSRPANVVMAVNKCVGKEKMFLITAHHQPQKKFIPGKDIRLEISFSKKPHAVVLYYRHVNHGERYMNVEMISDASNKYFATVPGSYTDSPYPLAYYFAIKETPRLQGYILVLAKNLKISPIL
jgi:hypothetical protein